MSGRSPGPAPALGLALAAGFLCASPAPAQIAFRDLAIAQAGHSKLFQPFNRTDLYDQFNLDATFGHARAGFRYESDENSERANTYRVFTQRYAELADDHVRLRVGNVYTLLGRGLVQRAFELPDIVLDEPGFYSRYGFSRDLDGALAEGEWGPVRARLVAGQPNTGITSPGTEALTQPRHLGELGGGELALGVWRGSRIGATYLRSTDELGTRQDELASGFVDLDPLRLVGQSFAALPLYAEYAQLNRSWEEWWKLKMGDRVPHAFYASSGLIWGAFTLSAEWKDYRRFRLGFNDPPSLVREHGFTLLNRSTHVLDAESEHGFQLEGSWALPEWGSLTVNQSRSQGTPAGRERRFEETYWELRFAPRSGERYEVTLFTDRGLDEFDFVSDRDIYGVSTTARMARDYSATLEVARKDATRIVVFGLPPSFSDHFLSVGVSRASWGSATFQWERTNDPRDEDPVRDVDPYVHALTFVSGTVAAQLSEHTNASLFVGKRRGGLACTAGTCYTVEPFKGAELRLTARY